jgi:tetratricopeptide (TPR) repeat protein
MVARTIASRILLSLVLSASAGGAGPIAHAESRDTSPEKADLEKAHRHFLIGKQAFEAGDYASAFQEFERGYLIAPRAGLLLDMGHAARRMGDQRRALELYRRFLTTDPPEDERRVAAKLASELQRDVPGGDAPSSAAAVSPLPAPSPDLAASGTDSASARPMLSLVDVAPTGEDAHRDSESTRRSPISRSWWFWAGAGGIAAGVATAILIGTLSSGSASSVRDSGTWGQLRL